jgi:hypothetical protein
MGGENNNDSNGALINLQTQAKGAMEWLRRSPFARQIAVVVGQELGRAMGTNQHSRMDASRAQALSNNLHQMMSYLIAECKEEQRKLRTGGVLGIGARDLSPQDIDTCVAGLTAITFHFETEMLDHLRKARGMGSAVAAQFLPATTEDSGQMATPQTMVASALGGTGVVGAYALPQDRIRLIGDQMRNIHEYAIKFATDIQEDIAGPHGASPSAHEKALSKSIMLAQRLDSACSVILQLLDPTIDPKSISSGNTDKLRAIPASDDSKRRR